MATCWHGKTSGDRRNQALSMVFMDTGAHLAEVAGLRYTVEEEQNSDTVLIPG